MTDNFSLSRECLDLQDGIVAHHDLIFFLKFSFKIIEYIE